MVMPAASEPALCVRERKCALLEVIELQRKLIEQREDSEELEWYAEQTKRLERFKLALNSLRLQPDEFALRVPCEWMPGSRTSARSRDDSRTCTFWSSSPYVLAPTFVTGYDCLWDYSTRSSRTAVGATRCRRWRR